MAKGSEVGGCGRDTETPLALTVCVGRGVAAVGVLREGARPGRQRRLARQRDAGPPPR